MLVLDNATGLCWPGWRRPARLSQASEVDGVPAARQPGSTLKPFLYAQAIAEQRLGGVCWWMTRRPRSPRPAACTSRRTTTASSGLGVGAHGAGASLNAPAPVRTLVMVTPDAFHRQLGALGLPLRENGDYFGYSLALGSAEVPLLHLTNAFRSLANGGRFQPCGGVADASAPGVHPGAGCARRHAFIVGDILSDGNARARTFGTDSVLATRFWSAVKTGTSKDMRDNWAVGWSERYTVGVWVAMPAALRCTM